MGLTKVSFNMIKGISNNPYDYGAVGDGVTNDTAALQAALNATTANNSFVLPPGVFLTGALTIANNFVSVIGLGGKLLGSGKNIKILQTNNKSDLLITGLVIEGQGKDDGFTSSGRGAIHVDANSERVQIIGNRILNANGSGIVEDGLGYCVISDNEINVTGEHGIYLSSSFKAVVSNNNIYKAGYQSALTSPEGYGIKIDGAVGCSITGNVINDSLTFGMQFAGNAERNTVTGNTIANTLITAESGIVLSGGASSRNIISNNTIYQNVAYPGIEVTSSSSNNTIADNMIVQRVASSNGITLSGNGNNLEGNTIIASVVACTYGIQISSDNNLVRDNHIYSDSGGTWDYAIYSTSSTDDNTICGNVVNNTVTNPYGLTNKSRDLYIDTTQYITQSQTTDATATTIYQFAVKASKTYSIDVEVVGTNSSGSEYAYYKGLYVATVNGSEVPTIAASNLTSLESTGSMTMTLNADSGGYLLVKVTGVAATTINWKLTKFDWREIA